MSKFIRAGFISVLLIRAGFIRAGSYERVHTSGFIRVLFIRAG